ncbi:uncharacterized protein LOC135841900 [Planococcus citri]|uniref:uncharacterized protein LOC135841900 n=1 Tax=Planococcus citri TaxID=170843 RepID=UPI0031FA31E9
MYLKIITLCSFVFLTQFFNVELFESLLSKELEEGLKAEEIIKECLKVKNKQNNLILEKLCNVGEDMGVVKYKLKLHERFKWFVTAREAIANTEERFAKNVNLNIPANMTDIFERRNEERTQRFMYILMHKKDENFVHELLKRIDKSEMTVDNFCRFISLAHQYLSQIIQNTALKKGDFEICYGYETEDDPEEYEKVNEALRIFMEGFTTKDNKY